MKRHYIVLGIAALCGAATSQNTLVSPDAVFVRSEGAGTAKSFGAFAQGRYQIIDDNQKGASRTLKEFCVRRDHKNYDVTNGMGRMWSNVSVHMSEGSFSSFSATFSTNSSTLPTRVFSNVVSWPIHLGAPASLPEPFNLAFPFSTNWSFSGNNGIVTDLEFTGGALANSSDWSGNTRAEYHLDSFFVGSFAIGNHVTLGHTNGGCVDSAHPRTRAAAMRLNMATYGPAMTNPVFRNKYFLTASGRNFAPNQPMMIAMAFLASVDGGFVGIPCNNVHLDFTRKWFFYPQSTDSVGNVPPYSFGLSSGLVAYQPQWAGFNLAIQGAWNDSRTGALKLSAASRNSFSALPVASAADVKMKIAYDYDPSRTTALFAVNADSTAIPIVCYKD